MPKPSPSTGTGRCGSAPSRSASRREAFARLARRAIETGLRQRGAREPVRPRHDHRRRPAGLFQGHLPERMNAYERFLAIFPSGTARSPICRSRRAAAAGIQEYAEMEACGRRGGRPHQRHASARPSWTPLRYINRPYSRTALAGLYRAARAGLVTPMRDGMNLVAKEYVAAQDRGRSRRADPVALCRRRARIARRRCWSIPTILRASRSPSIARCRCRSTSAVSATRSIIACWCRTISAIGPSDFSPSWKARRSRKCPRQGRLASGR